MKAPTSYFIENKTTPEILYQNNFYFFPTYQGLQLPMATDQTAMIKTSKI